MTVEYNIYHNKENDEFNEFNSFKWFLLNKTSDNINNFKIQYSDELPNSSSYKLIYIFLKNKHNVNNRNNESNLKFNEKLLKDTYNEFYKYRLLGKIY